MQRQFRLRKQADYQRVRQGGRSWAHPLVILSAVRNTLDHPRIGLVVSRKLGGAVQRNRVRRVLREALRTHLPRLQAGWDLVVVARAPLAGLKRQAVEVALGEVLSRAKLLAEPDGPAPQPEAVEPTGSE